MSVENAKVFSIGDSEIRAIFSKEGRINNLISETAEWISHSDSDELKNRASSKISLAYNAIFGIATTVRNLSDVLDIEAKETEKEMDAKQAESSLFRRAFGLINEEVQDALIAIATLRKYEHIASYLGARLDIVEESLEADLEKQRKKAQNGEAANAELPDDLTEVKE